MGILDGRVAIVTGASRGIRAEIARRFGAAGAAAAAAARSTEAGTSPLPGTSAETAEQIRAAGGTAGEKGRGWILNISSGAARHPAFYSQDLLAGLGPR